MQNVMSTERLKQSARRLWWLILVLIVGGALLFGGMNYLKQRRAANAPTVNDTQKSESREAELSEIQLEDLHKEQEALLAYVKTSRRYQSQPLNYPVVKQTLHLKNGDTTKDVEADSISLKSLLQSDTFYQEACDLLGENLNARVIDEIVSATYNPNLQTVSLEVNLENPREAKGLLKLMGTTLAANWHMTNGELPKWELVAEGSYTRVENALTLEKQEIAKRIESLGEQITNVENLVSDAHEVTPKKGAGISKKRLVLHAGVGAVAGAALSVLALLAASYRRKNYMLLEDFSKQNPPTLLVGRLKAGQAEALRFHRAKNWEQALWTAKKLLGEQSLTWIGDLSALRALRQSSGKSLDERARKWDENLHADLHYDPVRKHVLLIPFEEATYEAYETVLQELDLSGVKPALIMLYGQDVEAKSEEE